MYTRVLTKEYANLVLLKKIVVETDLKGFRLFVTNPVLVEDDDFQKELN